MAAALLLFSAAAAAAPAAAGDAAVDLRDLPSQVAALSAQPERAARIAAAGAAFAAEYLSNGRARTTALRYYGCLLRHYAERFPMST